MIWHRNHNVTTQNVVKTTQNGINDNQASPANPLVFGFDGSIIFTPLLLSKSS